MRSRFALSVPSGPVANGDEVVLVALAAAVHVRAQAVDALLPICWELGFELREVGVRQLDVAVQPIPDRELSRIIKRSMKSISNRRWRLRKAASENKQTGLAGE